MYLNKNIKITSKEFPQIIINVLTKNYKLSEIVSIINKISSIKDINWIDTPLINQYSYKVDDTKLKNLGWKSNDDIKECIKNTLEQLKNLKSK